MKRLITALAGLTLLCSLAGGCAPKMDEPSPTPPGTDQTACIYVSIVTHNEEPTRPEHPRFLEDREVFLRHRAAIVRFARMLHEEQVKYNFQSDWNFLLAALTYDRGTDETNGKNLLRFLKEDLGFEVDPHAHEKVYSYADVAYLIEALGVQPSHLVGGLLAMPPDRCKLEYLWRPVAGRKYDYVWKAEGLWGGGTSLHVNEEALWVSGIWKPRDNESFLIHDPGAPLPHIGGFKTDWEGLEVQLGLLRAGRLGPGKVYTQTIFIPQTRLLEDGFSERFRQAIRDYSEETAEGIIRWVGLSELLSIWRDDYSSEPNQLPYDPE